MGIEYLIGDATRPVYPDGEKAAIIHIVNDQRIWGAGFVIALSRRWPSPERVYGLFQDMTLGTIREIPVEPNLMVVNMVAQRMHGDPRVSYEHLRRCLSQVAILCSNERITSVHMPRIGCGLGGGSWEEIEPIIQEELVDKGLRACVYDLE